MAQNLEPKNIYIYTDRLPNDTEKKWRKVDYMWYKTEGTAPTWVKVNYVYQKQSDNTWKVIWPSTGVIMYNADITLTVPPGVNFVDFVLVGGGGGGGAGAKTGKYSGVGGGGGSGGIIYERGFAVQAGQQYVFTCGKGGAGAAPESGSPGQPGTNSTITGPNNVSFTAFGGAGGSGTNGPSSNPGGSGGGGGVNVQAGVGPPTAGGVQGYPGEYGATDGSHTAGGGGGGARGPGGMASAGQAGRGGDGFEVFVTGSSLTLGGGGAGGAIASSAANSGGTGGGGASGQDAKPDTGSGGGGAGNGSDSAPGCSVPGKGSNGVIYINFYSRYFGPVAAEVDSGTGKVIIPVGGEIRPAGGGGGCFIGTTLVLMEDFSLKPIAEVLVGDRVRNFDASKINIVTYVDEMPAAGYRIYSPDINQEPFATVNHPLYVNGKLSSLEPESTVLQYPWLGAITPIEQARVSAVPYTETVFNLGVDGDNTYQVNGFGTTSISDDGGITLKMVRRGIITEQRAREIVSIVMRNANTATGAYFINKLAGKLDVYLINKILMLAFKDNCNLRIQSLILALYQLAGKVIKWFR